MRTSLTRRPSGLWAPSRRSVLQAGGLGALALTLAACAGPAVGDDATAADEEENVDWASITPAEEITWWSNHPGASKPIEEEIIKRFNAEHPEITVKLVTGGANYDEIAQRFQAASSTDNLPDLVIASDVWWFRYFINGQIMPLDKVFAHLGVDTGDFVPTLYGDYEFEGQHWAAPYARSTPLFYYNKDLWAKAGLPDRGPKNWAELEGWGEPLRGVLPDGGAPLGLATGTSWAAWWFSNILWGHGGAYSDEWAVTLDTPEAVAAGNYVRDMYHGPKAYAAVGTDTNADFAAGTFAALIGSTGSLSGLLEASSFELGTAFLPDGPKGPGRYTPTGGTGLAIPASRTPEQQLAAAMFLAFLTNEENTSEFSKGTGYMPVRTSAIDGPIMGEVYAQTPQFRTSVDQLTEKTRSQDRSRVFVPSGDKILTDGLEKIVLRGTDAETVWAEVTPQLERAFSDNVEPYL
ncbi:ABC transporter substrate-binding protein [Georgenia ruanii]|uniref:Extracellular solute-binding protein n=1 Tax=Georgenia ruanii TaxID=348442 RepID=A0A7J9UWK8_9MICO|nr:ABC transporter substrate-binding protein [Georgenia ruanii]MPV89011.1 extracellular solute-binding protein [Georgenia ruanii]